MKRLLYAVTASAFLALGSAGAALADGPFRLHRRWRRRGRHSRTRAIRRRCRWCRSRRR